MLRENLNELEKNIEYFDYHNKNLTKEQDKRLMAIKCLLEELKNTHVWFEVARYEVETVIDDIYNDSLYEDYKEKLGKITDEDINRIAWKVSDNEYTWEVLHDITKNELYDEIGVGSDDEY